MSIHEDLGGDLQRSLSTSDEVTGGSESIGGTSKIWGIPGFANAPYSPKFLKGFCSHGPSEYICQV